MIQTENRSTYDIVQDIFSALVRQGGRCMSEEANVCAYERTNEDGTVSHCAAGWLIPEGKLKDDDLGRPVDALVHDEVDLGPNEEWIADNVELLQLCQRTHDESGAMRSANADLCDYLKDEYGFHKNPPAIEHWVKLREAQIAAESAE